MIDVYKTAEELRKSGSELGKGISEEEVPYLFSKLIIRLNTTSDVLNLTPKSYKQFSKLLLKYYQHRQEKVSFSDEEIVEMVREISAYFGAVIIKYSDGKWESGNNLFDTMIEFEGPIKGKKGSVTITYKRSSIALVSTCASAWKAFEKNVEPQFDGSFEDLVPKRHRKALK